MLKEKLKFSTQLKTDFIIELREKVKLYFETNRISKFGNMNMALKTVFMVLLYLVPYFAMVLGYVTSLPAIFICWFLMGTGMAGIGMGFMHDAIHGSYSKRKQINAIFGNSLYLLGGFPLNWQFQHNTLHHGFTNIDGYDDDIDPVKILRFSPHKPLLRIHKYQHWYAWFFYGLMTISWTVTKDFQQLKRYKQLQADLIENKSLPFLYFKLIVFKLLFYAVFLLVPLLTLAVSWYWVLLGYFVMHFTAGFILSTIFQTAHVVPLTEFPLPDNGGNLQNNWAVHQLLTTSDFAPKSRLFSWYIGGLNYQVEHHLFPNISHVHYKKLAKLVKETAEKYSVPYNVQPSFIVAVRNHARMLKRLGRE